MYAARVACYLRCGNFAAERCWRNAAGFCTKRPSETASSSTSSSNYVNNPRLNAKQLGKPAKIPREYASVSVIKTDTNEFNVALDDKPMKTPKGNIFAVPSELLANMIAEEWRSQTDHIRPDTMPMMTIACTAIDVVGEDLAGCIERLMPYLETDTLCYVNSELAEESWERSLGIEQANMWTPIRGWFENVYGAVGVSYGLTPPKHPVETLAKVKKDLEARNMWQLAAMEVSTRYTKSLICATRYMADDATAREAMDWALLEENFQIVRCGMVEGEHDMQRDNMLRWLQAAKDFCTAL